MVTLRYEGDDEDETTDFFVGSIEERQGDLTVVSPGSPLGQALLGHTAGDTVEYAAPGRYPQGRNREHRGLTPMTDAPTTLSEKVWDRHVVHPGTADEPDVIFIDLHLIHEVTSPQAFDGLRLAGRRSTGPT